MPAAKDRHYMGRRTYKPVFFFGHWEPLLGEYDGDERHQVIYTQEGKPLPNTFFKYLPWTRVELSGGLLLKRNIVDRPNGTIYWGQAYDWTHWIWWDRSARDQPGTTSCFLAYKYPALWFNRALGQCIRTFPHIVQRQEHELQVHNRVGSRHDKLGLR